MQRGILVLEDGTVLEGDYRGPKKNTFAEIVFNTSMTGYEEAFTDPSYNGQILLMTYPLIGNYGVRKKHFESNKVQIRGLVLKEPSFFHYRGINLSDFINRYHIPCIYRIDTRTLTLKIRRCGTMRAMIIGILNLKRSIDEIIDTVRNTPFPDSNNLVHNVSCKKVIFHNNLFKKTIVLIDCGVKLSILRQLTKYASVIQVPYNTAYDTITDFNPDGIVISNGPGNPGHPEIMSTTIKTVDRLIGKYPIMGICLGHQILGIALGFKTYKLKFGHRGSNHAVMNLKTNKVYVTSQNHGYALRTRKIKDVSADWVNVNDRTIEGICHKRLPIFSVQFHPEAAPGPFDTSFLFKKFIESV